MRCSSCGRAVRPCFPALWCMPCANLIRRLRSRGLIFRHGLQGRGDDDSDFRLCDSQVLWHQVDFGVEEGASFQVFRLFGGSSRGCFGRLRPVGSSVQCGGHVLNGLSLGCMWGVIFSFIEGRKVTDMLASLLGVSMVFSSGVAKSFGLFAMNEMHVGQFWMPAVIGAFALPLLVFMGYMLKRLPQPTEEDIALRNERVTLDGNGRKLLFRSYAPILTLLFVGNFMLLVLRDIKEDFLVNILDMSNQSSWLFAQVDTIVTLVILGIFAAFIFFRSNIRALMCLMGLVIAGCLVMTYVSLNYEALDWQPVVWLFVQSLCLYIAYLTFQTIFFDRFIACFRIRGNVGFFIAIIDFIGYMGTVTLLSTKEFLNFDMEWFALYNHMACAVGAVCAVLFTVAAVLIYKRYSAQGRRKEQTERTILYMNPQYNAI